MRYFITLLLATVSLSPAAFAQDAKPATAPSPEKVSTEPLAAEPAPTKYSPILPVKIKPRQAGADEISKAAADIEQENNINPDSLGLLFKASDGALGTDLWKSYTSAKLDADLAALNLNISSPTLRSLLLRALLTTPDTEAFDDDKKSEAFSARLMTLIDLGSYDETVQLYKKLEGSIPSAKSAYAGVQGIVGTGKLGLACLEEKAVSEDLKTTQNTSFWPDLKLFCQILLTADAVEQESDDATTLVKSAKAFAQNKKLAAPATLQELNSKSVIEILALNKAGLIAPSLFTPDNAKPLKPQTVSFLLKQSPVSQSERLTLLATGMEKGLVTQDAYETEFLTQSRIAPVAGSAPGYWQPVLASYSKIQASASDADKATQLKAVLKQPWSNTTLLPFGKLFGSLKTVDSFTPEESRKVISLLIRSQTNVSGVWFAQGFGKIDAKNKESVTDIEVISALEELKSSGKTPEDAKTHTGVAESGKSDQNQRDDTETLEKAQLHAVSLILQGNEVEDKSEEKSYEKLLSLTAPNDYVMPTMELINGLKQASLSQDTGKVIIYSLQVLNGQRVSQIHPTALFRITEGLKSVGLSEETRSLAHEVLADLIEFKN